MSGVRAVSLALLVFPVVTALLGGCRRSTHCPEGWRAEPVGSPVEGYWCRSPKGDSSQYRQVHPDGRTRQICNYTADRPDGPFEAFHPDGKRWIEGQFVAGRPHGPWTQWDDRGVKAISGEYRHGQLVRGGPIGVAAVCDLALEAARGKPAAK